MTDAPSSTAPAPADPFAEFLCFSVYSTGLAFNRIYKPLLDRLGLTYVQYLALIALAQHEDRTMSELGGDLYLESNTLTPLVKRLEAAGFVTRKRDSADERVVRVALTAQGHEAVAQAGCVSQEVVEATGLPVAELVRLNEELKVLRRNLRAAS